MVTSFSDDGVIIMFDLRAIDAQDFEMLRKEVQTQFGLQYGVFSSYIQRVQQLSSMLNPVNKLVIKL